MNEDKSNPNNKEEKFQPPPTKGKTSSSSSSLSPTLTPIIAKEIVTKRSSITEETEQDSVVHQNKRRKVPVEVFKGKEEHLPIVRQKSKQQQQQKQQKQKPLKVIITPIMGKEFHFDNLENPTIFDIKDAIYRKLDLEHEAQILTPSITTSNTAIDDSTPLRSLMGGRGGGGGQGVHLNTINLRLSIKTMTGMKFSTSLPDYEFISSEMASPFSTDVEGFNGSGNAESLEQILLNTAANEGGADRRLAVVDVVSEGGTNGRKGKKSLLVEFDGDSLANAKIIGELSSNGVIRKSIPNFLTEGANSNSNSSAEDDGEDADADDDAVVVAEDDNNSKNNNVVSDPKEDISTYLDRAINIKDKIVEQTPPLPKVEDGPVRCTKCNRKCRLGGQFRCRCDLIFCGTHRYPDMHSCTFDHKAFGRKLLGKANPKLEDSHRL